jgi:hypothetical protein
MGDDECKYSVDRKRRYCCTCRCPPEAVLDLNLHDRLHYLAPLMHLPVPERRLGNACLYETWLSGTCALAAWVCATSVQ